MLAVAHAGRTDCVIDHIPLFDPLPQYEALAKPIQDAVQRVFKSGWYYLGPEGEAFESEIAAYLGVRHAIGVNSGTDALVIGLRCLGIQPGDEVITTPFTFFATAEAICLVGATPVFVDIEPDTYNIDPEAVERAITPRTRCIIPVHLFGHSADMAALQAIAEQHDLVVLEDAAQALGAETGGEKVGTLADVGAFSFFPTKTLGAYGDGGLIATNNDEVAERARILRVHGSLARDHHIAIGYNSRLDEIHAAILRVKLTHLDRWNEARREAAQWYAELLRDVPEIQLPVERPGDHHVYGQYTIRVLNGRRDALQAALKEQGISTGIYYSRPLHMQPVFSDNAPSLPVAEQAAQEVLSLPMWPGISRVTVERVAEAIIAALRD